MADGKRGRGRYYENNEGPNVVPISTGVLLLVVGVGLALLEEYILQASAWISTVGFVLVGLGFTVIFITMMVTYFGGDQ